MTGPEPSVFIGVHLWLQILASRRTAPSCLAWLPGGGTGSPGRDAFGGSLGDKPVFLAFQPRRGGDAQRVL
jgi:hypothetical protein